jgi:hypothetical protein
VGSLVRKGARIETFAGAVDIQEQIVVRGEAVRPGGLVGLWKKYLPLLLVLKNVDVRFARVLFFRCP